MEIILTEEQRAVIRKIFEQKRPIQLYPEFVPGRIVALCEKCGLALTMDNWWKIGGKNLCNTHGESYATYLNS